MNFATILQDYKTLTASEERIVLESAKKGSAKARQTLIMSIMPLIISMARSFSRRCSVSLDDLVGEGVVGAYKAIDAFDLSNSTRYSTFALNNGRVKAEMQKAINESHLVGMPVADRKNGTRNIYQSFDSPCTHDSDSLNLSEVLPDLNADSPDEINVIKLETVSIADLIARLPESEDKKVLTMFSTGMTAREIEKNRGYSRQTAINNRDRAISALQKMLKEEGVLV